MSFTYDTARAYLAAMIDGEGTIYFDSGPRKERKINIVNTSLDIIAACEECLKILDISFSRYYSGERSHVKWQGYYTIRIGRKKNLELVLKHIPLQCVRKLQNLQNAVNSYTREWGNKI